MNCRILLLPLALMAIISCGESTIDPEPEPVENDFRYVPSTIAITTDNGKAITGKEKEDYVNCTISINSEVEGWSGEYTGKIRGRGNSTWLWYPKKPYRIKLDEKAEILGMREEKDWVFLANYRDPTNVMNSYVFTVGQTLGRLPYTNSVRYAEVSLNGDYIGLYQITEQVEQGKKRVAVADDGGVLISLDEDDGPNLSPEAKDNFWSKVYHMPVCVKYPEEPELLEDIKNELAVLENAIKAHDYNSVDKLLDIQSLIDYLIIQELVYNVELAAPRSIYMHRDNGGKWVMGPLWDFDAGFDFDWSTMYTGHNYFMSFRELVLGNNPQNTVNGVPRFFLDMFKNSIFREEYKLRWKEISPLLVNDCWEELEKYIEGMEEAMARNAQRWPIDKKYDAELIHIYDWLASRVDYLDTIVANY